jgi:thiamine biosynthesis lipoprotein
MASKISSPSAQPVLVEKRFRSMGTDVTVLVPPGHVEAYGLARDTVADWDLRFSRFRLHSELSALNRAAGSAFGASDLLFDVVVAAIEAAEATDGLFDPLLAARMAELGYDRTFDALPAFGEPRVTAAWTPGLWRRISLDARHRTIRLPAGSGIDLGGIAKGIAVDAALARLVAGRVPYAAVNAGGDLAVHGTPPGFVAWPIQVEGAGQVVTLAQGALATSSILQRRWRIGDQEHHHLIDPRTGLPSAGDLVSASVAGATCAQAEVAAKAALLGGWALGAAFIEREHLTGLLVGRDGSIRRIGRWADAGGQVSP